MREKERTYLTEPMFYILMSFLHQDMCGIDITEYVRQKTFGRIHLGAGTLYTILGKFLDQKLIEEIEVCGRKRTYRLTEKGRTTYYEEVERLKICLHDAETAETEEDLCDTYAVSTEPIYLT